MPYMSPKNRKLKNGNIYKFLCVWNNIKGFMLKKIMLSFQHLNA